jgi:hypothetical protein
VTARIYTAQRLGNNAAVLMPKNRARPTCRLAARAYLTFGEGLSQVQLANRLGIKWRIFSENRYPLFAIMHLVDGVGDRFHQQMPRERLA